MMLFTFAYNLSAQQGQGHWLPFATFILYVIGSTLNEHYMLYYFKCISFLTADKILACFVKVNTSAQSTQHF